MKSIIRKQIILNHLEFANKLEEMFDDTFINLAIMGLICNNVIDHSSELALQIKTTFNALNIKHTGEINKKIY